MKKKVIIISLSVLIIAFLAFGIYLVLHKEEKNTNKFDSVVTSSVILDINPSIKLELNKSSQVVNVVALNEDANQVVSDDLKEKELTDALKSITENLINKGYITESADILLNTDGIDTERVKTIIETELKEKEVTYNIIVPTIIDTAKDLAKKYDITESKAAYLESIVSENSDIKIEDIKDKSIKETQEIVKALEEKVNEEKENNKPETTKPSNNETNNSGNTISKPSRVSKPSDATDTSGVWCTYRKNMSLTTEITYDKMISLQAIKDYALASLGKNESYFTNIATSLKDDKRSSYCLAQYVTLYSKESEYHLVVDSVTGKIIESKEVSLPSFITEEKAMEIGLKYYNLTKDACRIAQVAFDYNAGYYRYQFNAIDCSDGKSYSVDINATNGQVVAARSN